MVRFIKRVLIFILSSLLVVFTYHFLIFKLILSDNNYYKVDQHITTLVLGDSHTETAVNDGISENIKNLSFKGESVFFTYYKLKKIFEANSHIENIVLGFSYHSLNQFQDSKFQSLLYEYIWLLNSDGVHMMDFSVSNMRMLLKNINSRFYDRLMASLKGVEFKLLGGGNRQLEIDKLSEATSKKRIQKHYIQDDGVTAQGYSVLQQRYFDKIITLCVERGVRLVLLNTPLHSSYYSNVPNQFIDEYYAMINALKLRYPNLLLNLDYYNLVASNQLFYDGDHLNSKGSSYFMRIFLKDLAELLS